MLDELNLHQAPHVKSKIKISLCRRKSYQRTYLEEIRSRFDQVRPVVSHLEVCLPNKPPTPKNIGEGLKVPKRQFWKKPYLWNITRTKMSAFFCPPPNQIPPWRKKFLHSLISNSNKEGGCSDAWKFVARHCANDSSHIKCIYFDQSYSPVAHTDPLISNIAITAIYRLTVIILDISNAFQNTNVPINERFCVSTPPYYIDW